VSVAIIINPVSGGGRRNVAHARAQVALAVVEAHGDTADVMITERSGHARELAKAATLRGARLVMVWGGDGTINEVASALVFNDVPLGIIPAGSGNGLARELGVRLKPELAIADALAAEPRLIDVGEIEGRYFVNIAGIGLDAHVASQFNTPGNQRRGLLGYARISLRALGSYVPGLYRISHTGRATERRAILVTVANSAQFGNGARIAPGAKVDDGWLDLVVVEERSRWRTLMQLPRLFNGTIRRIPGCTIDRIQRATIESDAPMMFHVDGEPREGGTRLRVRLHPGALWVAIK